jgi:hypothetical protein
MMFTGLFKSWKSNSREYRTPVELVKAALDRLVTSRSILWVTFELKPLKEFAEVAIEGDEFLINIAFPYKEDFRVMFERCGLELPEGWQVKEFEARGNGLFSAGSLILTTSKEDRARLAQFVHELFLKLYRTPADYQLKAVFQ